MEKRHLVRQSILNAQRGLAGYDLQVWEKDGREGAHRHPTAESARLLINLINSSDLAKLVESQPVFLSFPGAFLFHDYEEMLPPGRIILMAPQTAEDTGLVEAIRARRAEGVRVGFDIDAAGPAPPSEVVAELDFLRFDLARLGEGDGLSAATEPFRATPVPWIARNVHSHSDFERCLELGFGLFTGQFFTQPLLFSKDGLSARQMALVEVFQQLSAGAEFPEIEATFKAYPDLSFQLLELLNSAAMRRKEPIYSIRQSLVLLGQNNLRKWVALLLFTGGDGEGPNPLYEEAVIRGRIMEMAASRIQDSDAFTGGAFLTGIFSVIQALLMRPLRQIAQDLQLDRGIALALVERKGVLGHLLDTVAKLREEKAPEPKLAVGGITFRDQDWFSFEEQASLEYGIG
ncbi:EAL and HDOD domain-containing protein [Thiohalorhabdus methylotrophus]|uniref:EAL and HDOD domain-containing protein n=1 Tax=Thiohalorhabdus methylotrophus TaxID=3242694 RepID=A0ABV4TXS6_9GAMM